MKRLLMVCLMALCLYTLAHAAEYTVDPAGAGDFTSLTAALAIAQDGDRLILSGGVYDDSIESFPILVEKRVEIACVFFPPPGVRAGAERAGHSRVRAADRLSADGHVCAKR